MFIVLGIFAIALLFYHYLYKPQLYWKRNNVKQGPPVPLLGDHWRFLLGKETVNDLLLRIYNRFPNERYSGFYQTIIPGLLIRDPELIKQIAIKDFDYFTDHRNFTPEHIDPIWKRHLFALKGEEWRNMRETLSPTFTSRKMKAMFNLMNESGRQFINHFNRKNEEIIEVEGKDILSRFANDVIANCAFGITCDSLDNPKNDFYVHGKEITDLSGIWKGIKFVISLIAPKLAGYLKISIFPDYCGKYFKRIVKETVDYREKNNVVRPDMLNLLMEARSGKLSYDEDAQNSKTSGFATVEESQIGTTQKQDKKMSEEDMAAQVLIFFFAGFDTISTSMAFLIYELARNQEVQQKLREEIDESVEKTNGKLTYDVLFGLKYLDKVITEGLRKYSPVIGTDRVCVKPYTIEPVNADEKPVHLKVGDSVWFASIAMHFDPKYFPNPDRFDPERFSDENKHLIQPYTYFPFGNGPRNCIGSRFALMEMKILFYHLLANFEVVVIEKTPIPMRMAKGAVVPQLEGGYWVGLQKRQKQ